MRKPPKIDERPIEILSIYKINEKIKEQGRLYSHCISISDSKDDEPCLDPHHNFTEVLELRFHDINTKSDMPRDQHPKPPSKMTIRRLVKFLRRTSATATGFTIHCHAGVHRSVAAGFIGLFLMTHDSISAKDELIRIKAIPLPNKRMISLFDRMYNVELSIPTRELYERCQDFLTDKIQIDQDDYLDELDSIED